MISNKPMMAILPLRTYLKMISDTTSMKMYIKASLDKVFCADIHTKG